MSNVTECGKATQRLLVLCCLLLLVAPAIKTSAQAVATPTRPLVEIRTELGTLVVALYNETPQHRDNFLKLVREHAYDSLLFHRVIADLMVQGGDPDSKRAAPGAPLGQGGPGYTLPAEIVPGLIHKKGALAAARQADQVNPERRSNGSQFYIVQGKTYKATELDQVVLRNARYGTPVTYTEEHRKTYASVGGTPHLDGAYTVFGEVVEGVDVLEALSAQLCDGRDRPLKDVRMFMRVLE